MIDGDDGEVMSEGSGCAEEIEVSGLLLNLLLGRFRVLKSEFPDDLE